VQSAKCVASFELTTVVSECVLSVTWRHVALCKCADVLGMRPENGSYVYPRRL